MANGKEVILLVTFNIKPIYYNALSVNCEQAAIRAYVVLTGNQKDADIHI